MVSLFNFQEDFVVSNLFFYLLIKSQVYNFGVVSASIHLLSVCFFFVCPEPISYVLFVYTLCIFVKLYSFESVGAILDLGCLSSRVSVITSGCPS